MFEIPLLILLIYSSLKKVVFPRHERFFQRRSCVEKWKREEDEQLRHD